MKTKIVLLITAFTFSLPTLFPVFADTVNGAIDARMMRYPDVSATQIAFVYAGDIWIAPKTGGTAVRLSSPRGEEMFPRFSPDGSLLAFSGNYDGNIDVYVVPVGGGLPKRLTHHGAPDRVLGWYPDGQAILFATSMTSQKDRFNQLRGQITKPGLIIDERFNSGGQIPDRFVELLNRHSNFGMVCAILAKKSIKGCFAKLSNIWTFCPN